MTRFAHRLALALWNRASEAGQERAVASELSEAYRIFRGNPRLRQVMIHPGLDRGRRAELLSSIFHLNDIAMDFLLLLAEHRAFSCFGEALRGFNNYRAVRSAELPVEVHSVDPLSRHERKKLAEALEGIMGRKVRILARTRRDILGGLKIRVGELTIDGTLRGAFERLEKQLAFS